MYGVRDLQNKVNYDHESTKEKRDCIEAMRLLKRKIVEGPRGGVIIKHMAKRFSLMMKFTLGQSLEHRVLEV